MDISNGLVFFDISLDSHEDKLYEIKYLDRMVVMSVVKEGSFSIKDNVSEKVYTSKSDESDIYCSSRQDFSLKLKKSKRTEVFVLFIADFFLKDILGVIKMNL